MDPRPVRGCPPSLRPALLFAALAAVLLAPQTAARGLDDPIYIPIAIVLDEDLPVGHYQVDYCKGSTCVAVSSKPCVGVAAAGAFLDVDPHYGVYVEAGGGPAAYGGYSARCMDKGTADVDLGDQAGSGEDG